MDQDTSGVLGRVLPGIGGIEIVERLAALSGSDFTSVLLEVARRRAARETPVGVLRRYQRDRFVRPSAIPWRSLRQAEDALLGALSSDAAVRRGRPGAGTVRLAGVQRVVRAQQFPAGYFPHFSLFGLVTAGRDEGSGRFERSALAEHLRFAIRGLTAAGAPAVQVALTPLSDAGTRIATAVAEELAGQAGIGMDHARQGGRGYYRDVCFKVNVLDGGEVVEIGDGGCTDWTAKLTANQKERLLISGYGLDRLSAFAEGGSVQTGRNGHG